jgi:hypothetical protein
MTFPKKTMLDGSVHHSTANDRHSYLYLNNRLYTKQPIIYMQRILLYTSLLLFSFYQAAQAQEKPYIIPFDLTSNNNLSVKAVVNRKDTVLLMFHTAASSVTLMRCRYNEKLGR